MVVIALLFIGTFVFLYQKSQPKDVEYNVLKVVKSNIVQTTVATGKIEPRDEVQIKPQISGIISEVYKEAGETVKKGEVIAKVKVIPELGQLNSAESRVRLAEMNGRQAEIDLEWKNFTKRNWSAAKNMKRHCSQPNRHAKRYRQQRTIWKSSKKV